MLMASLSTGAGVALAGGGGVSAPEPPSLRDVACVESCAGIHQAIEGSKVEATGRHLGHVTKVVFSGESGPIPVEPNSASARLVKAKVPAGAVTGKPRVVDSYSNMDASPNDLEIVSDLAGGGGSGTGTFRLRSAKADPDKVFYRGRRRARVNYSFSGSGATDVRIRVVHRKDREVVDSWIQDNKQPDTVNTARWQGSSGDPIRGYRFRIGPAGGHLDSTDGAKFSYFKYKFPIRGPHTYGDGIGAGRGHRGQDVFADCGTPLVAARGGKVQWRAYQGAGAGYYVVIDGRGTGRDFVYMHLRGPARVHEGEWVKTGERIGAVGESGNASGCHLHFEIWSPSGWYEGGSYTDPTDDLKRWDRYS